MLQMTHWLLVRIVYQGQSTEAREDCRRCMQAQGKGAGAQTVFVTSDLIESAVEFVRCGGAISDGHQWVLSGDRIAFILSPDLSKARHLQRHLSDGAPDRWDVPLRAARYAGGSSRLLLDGQILEAAFQIPRSKGEKKWRHWSR